ncbi:MAG TPA: outer membrane lipoprotein carrier protein LolA [Blastocatellia bacterium]|nr:outer membrane lipoprotein carrier protein LolA [Blastocatellia bacterium]
MKKIMTLALIAGLALAVAGAMPVVDANTSPQILTGILNKMETAHKQMKSLKAELIQEKINPQIGSKDSDYGTVIYKPAAGKEKGKLRIDYTKPGIKSLSVIGENFTFYEPKLNQAMKSTVGKAAKGKAGANLIGLDGSLKALLSNYNIDYVGDAAVNGQSTTILRLLPKSRGDYNSIDIWVSQSGLPVQWKMVERNGDYTVITLKNTQINTNIADSAFVINLPGGTKILDKL